MFDEKSVLDFGCDTGEVDLAITHWGGRVEGLDFSDLSISHANQLVAGSGFEKKLKFFAGDGGTYVTTENFYDFVISMGVIAHVPISSKCFLLWLIGWLRQDI